MTVLIMYLLKWHVQPEFRGKSWWVTIRTQRKALAKVFKNSPSLKRFLADDEWLCEIWSDALDDAMMETSRPVDMFPQLPIWTVEQMLDDEFLPE